MRLWYARRGIPWVPLLACLWFAPVAAVVGHRWPHVVGLLPAALAGCAAATAYLFDDPAAAATRVTPRGGRWAGLARCAVAALPAVIWCAVVATAPDAAEIDRSDWVVAGLGAQWLALGLAWAAARRGHATPGAAVAPAIAGVALMPFIVGPFVGWTPL
jgi:hypothetical protein